MIACDLALDQEAFNGLRCLSTIPMQRVAGLDVVAFSIAEDRIGGLEE